MKKSLMTTRQIKSLYYFISRFIDVNIGLPGKAHDAQVLFNSDIYSRGERNELFPKVRLNVLICKC